MVLMMIVMVSLITSCNIERKKNSGFMIWRPRNFLKLTALILRAHSMVMMGRVYIQLKV